MRLNNLYETAITDGDNFKRWFRNSKVVDSVGNPLVVYHGTADDILAFRDTADGIDGIYFTASPEISGEYSDYRHHRSGNGGQTIPVYLSLQNPHVVDYTAYQKMFGDDYEVSSPRSAGEFEAELLIDIVQTAKDFHKDGVILHNIRDGWKLNSSLSTTYIAFSPSQIKSVFNNGNFNTTDRISETAINELRNRTPTTQKVGKMVIVYRGDYWLVGYDVLNDDPDLNDQIGKALFGPNFGHPYAEDVIDSIRDSERPDIGFGSIDDNMLRVDYQFSSAAHPITSPMLKKIVKELDLLGVTVGGVDYYGDETEEPVSRYNMQGELPDWLYHGTSSKHIEFILRTGLRAGETASNWIDAGISHDNVIFGTTSFATASFHANRTAGIQADPDDFHPDPDDDFPIVIQFKIPDKNLLLPDYDVANETLPMGDINTSQYANIDRFSGSSHGVDLSKAWKSAGMFAYQGRIPPSQITMVYTPFWESPLFDQGGNTWHGKPSEYFDALNQQRNVWWGDDDEEDW